MTGLDLTIQIVLMRLFAGLIIIPVHGAAIAAAAVLMGDRGPRYDGRLPPWSAGHFDMVGLGAIVLTGFGWGRPVAVEAGALRIGRPGLVVVVLAGSAALLVLAVLLLQLTVPLVTLLPLTPAVTAAAFVRTTARMCVWMALFSLLPVPPLAGAHVLRALGISLPRNAGTYLAWVLLAACVFGLTRMALAPAYDLIAPFVLGPDLGR